MHKKFFEQLRKVKIIGKTAMMYKKMKNACVVNDTACTCACGVIDTACTVHAVSLTPHAKYDTAYTIDERFERPWQPSKGISIKNIYVLELSYPTTKKLYKFKGPT
jgi:hypothetical protein